MNKPTNGDGEHKPVPPQKPKQPAEPTNPTEKAEGEHPRRMRWPADFPAKH
ncbi:hypothetical protein LMG6001_05290 [Achromobacter insolitus]|nr:hypothetical protein LMG6001_05290 [Achromobacter insolitus]